MTNVVQQIVILLVGTNVFGLQLQKTETIDFVLAGQELSVWRKDVNDGNHLTDTELKKRSMPSQGVSSLLIKAKLVDGKVNEIRVFYSQTNQPRVLPVREKAFTHLDPDFKYLIKAIGLTE